MFLQILIHEKVLPIFLSNNKLTALSFTFFKNTSQKKCNFTKILKSRYFLLGYGANVNFDLFWGAKVQFLQNVVWLSLWKVREKCMGYFKVVVFHGVCRSLLGLSQMTLINVLVFLVFKILNNLILVQKSLFANICWCKQKFKKYPRWSYLDFECTFRNGKCLCINLFSSWYKRCC